MNEEPGDLSPEELDRARDFVHVATDFYGTAGWREKTFEETVRAHVEADDAVWTDFLKVDTDAHCVPGADAEWLPGCLSLYGGEE